MVIFSPVFPKVRLGMSPALTAAEAGPASPAIVPAMKVRLSMGHMISESAGVRSGQKRRPRTGTGRGRQEDRSCDSYLSDELGLLGLLELVEDEESLEEDEAGLLSELDLLWLPPLEPDLPRA